MSRARTLANLGAVTSSATELNTLDDVAYVTATGPDSAAGTIVGDYKVHIFTATKTGANGFAVSNAGNAKGSNTVEYLVVAGGGAGGFWHASGGGAGGFRTATNLSVSAQNYDVTVGAGGSSVSSNGQGGDGSDSTFSTITSSGGGGGGH